MMDDGPMEHAATPAAVLFHGHGPIGIRHQHVECVVRRLMG